MSLNRIYLVRHGESLGNAHKEVHQTMADHAIPLSLQGRAQARRAGLFLREELGKIVEYLPRDPHTPMLIGEMRPRASPQVRLWNSPYTRARETAELIGVACNLGTGVIQDQREHVLLGEQQFGLFDGVPDEDLPKLFPKEHAYYKKCCQFGGKFWSPMPLGESRFDVAKRVHQAFGTFQRDADQNGVRNIVVVAHGTTIRAFVMMWCHKHFEWFEEEPNPKNCSVRLIAGSKDMGYVYDGE